MGVWGFEKMGLKHPDFGALGGAVEDEVGLVGDWDKSFGCGRLETVVDSQTLVG